ncbi:LTA synthase family protein [Cohnella herbarum]|uniref:LTA synthase family protein n=1 Tax=Cohnella herbarum TaxID=2728023 RepID=A0A7Z2ZJU7_9BACL|nr:LTA synthase family protein [Cohnella herbarum]QJD82536.1 LTA synthase family protein [Cohnella herbarum]
MDLTQLYRKPFVLFSIILLIKSQLAWMVVFESGPSWATIATELPFMWLVFCMIEWFATKRKLAIYVLVNLLLTLLFFSVIMYYKYYGVIATYHALEQVNQVTAVSNSVISLLDPQYLLIFTDVLVLAYVLFRRKAAKVWKSSTAVRSNRKVYLALFVISLAVCLFNVVPNRASMNEIKKAEVMGILNYEAYTLIGDKEPEPLEQEEINQLSINRLKGVTSVEGANGVKAYEGLANGRNVIVIQLESFQNFLVGLKLDGQEVTPVLNRLAKENMYFSKFYQQVGQGNTSDAEYVVNTSTYIPPSGAATMKYVDRQLPSLPKLLKDQGYDTATFHTNVVEFWNRGELYKALGFDRYYDKSFFGTEDSVFFGSSDEVLYEKTAAELDKMSQSGNPFYAHVISMTAHHPFTTPEEKDRIELPERYEGTFVGDYIRSQSYADYALGQFIDELKASGIWDNSLIVVYGDHLGLPMYSLDDDDKELMEEIYGHPYGYTDMINIPLVIAAPGKTQPVEFTQTGGQVDVLPTIANLLGVSLENQIHFGQDLLNNRVNLLPERYYLPSGSVINGEVLFIPGIAYDDGTTYSLNPNSGTGGKLSEKEYNTALDLLHMSDSYVIQLPALENADEEPAK